MASGKEGNEHKKKQRSVTFGFHNINMKPVKIDNYLSSLINLIRILVEEARGNVTRNIIKEILQTYWQIGKHIVEFEQKGNLKAEYGKQLLINLSKELSIELGKGF